MALLQQNDNNSLLATVWTQKKYKNLRFPMDKVVKVHQDKNKTQEGIISQVLSTAFSNREPAWHVGFAQGPRSTPGRITKFSPQTLMTLYGGESNVGITEYLKTVSCHIDTLWIIQTDKKQACRRSSITTTGCDLVKLAATVFSFNLHHHFAGIELVDNIHSVDIHLSQDASMVYSVSTYIEPPFLARLNLGWNLLRGP